MWETWQVRYGFALLALGLVGCASNRPMMAGGPVVDLHADTSFLPRERRAIQLAAIDAAMQTRGAVRIAVAFDVNAQASGALTNTDRLLLRVDSLTPFISTLGWKHGSVLGATVGQRRIYVVADRLHDERVVEHVVLHEMLHLYGLEHVGDPRAVMSVTTDKSSAIEFTPADQREFIRAYCSQ